MTRRIKAKVTVKVKALPRAITEGGERDSNINPVTQSMVSAHTSLCTLTIYLQGFVLFFKISGGRKATCCHNVRWNQGSDKPNDEYRVKLLQNTYTEYSGTPLFQPTEMRTPLHIQWNTSIPTH